jgi:hypothetical protein
LRPKCIECTFKRKLIGLLTNVIAYLGNNTKRKKSGIVSETAIVSDLLSF